MNTGTRLDNDSYDRAVGDAVKAAVLKKYGSLRACADATGIPYVTLNRKVHGHAPFTVRELRAVALATGRRTSSFLPSERAAA